MEKAKRFLAQFLVFMFWSAVATTIGLLVVYHFKHNILSPAWRWWDVLGFSVVSAAIIMTGKSVIKFGANNDDNFCLLVCGVGIFALWSFGLFFSHASVWILGQGDDGWGLLFLVPSGLGVILIMAFGYKNIENSVKRAAIWEVASIWVILLIFVSSLAVAKGFYFVAPRLGPIVEEAIIAVMANAFILVITVLIILAIRGLVTLHRTAFKKERNKELGINKK